MKSISVPAIVVLAALSLTAFVPNARAGMLDRKALITFSQPVEIPGLVLAAGSYVFERVDSTQHLVRILNANETHVYAILFTTPEYLLDPAGPLITFEERAHGAPEAVQAWFHPGETTGEEFLYMKSSSQVRYEKTDQK